MFRFSSQILSPILIRQASEPAQGVAREKKKERRKKRRKVSAGPQHLCVRRKFSTGAGQGKARFKYQTVRAPVRDPGCSVFLRLCAWGQALRLGLLCLQSSTKEINNRALAEQTAIQRVFWAAVIGYLDRCDKRRLSSLCILRLRQVCALMCVGRQNGERHDGAALLRVLWPLRTLFAIPRVNRFALSS
ncbi:hypothetical protein M011DRAFT_191932 [Sporormia fimetaria CBS 119925]|uniref:Uncharacterized protein n=1 Tax=Sporormia fimetaria CBS 119925 TaxID=1340428 RepID=A0A6A6V3M1_9PLEO|nr:hypothetical protein M011DRAFT_191932 [Sporormia fimetaria CBS 119925]